MERKRLLIDMDHVMADITSQFIKWYSDATGTEINRDDLVGKPEDLAFPQPDLIRNFLYMPGFFRTAPVMTGSREVVRELNALYDIYIVSAALEFPQSLIEKYEWLSEHFPFLGWQQIVFCGSKKAIVGDYMIDDHLKNLNHFTGEKILFSATHNIGTHINGYKRVNDWEEVRSMFIENRKHS